MSENSTEETPLNDVPIAVDTAPTDVAPQKKKRGPKPKVALPPPVPVEAPRTRKRRSAAARATKGERAIAAAVSAAQVDRVKCIDELTKVMQMQYSKEGVLKALDWKIGMLAGNPTSNNIPAQSYPAPNYPLPPQYPQPPAYPPPATPFIPPSMRTPNFPPVPVVPQAGGGAVETAFETEEEDPDKFLKVGGVMGDGNWK